MRKAESMKEQESIKAGDAGIGCRGKSTSQTSGQPGSLSFKGKHKPVNGLHQ
jgi:hypothetical protein